MEFARNNNLMRCPDCGKEISVQAKACPGCGRPTNKAKEEEETAKRNNRGNVQGIGCLLILMSFFSFLLSPLLGGPLLIIGLIIIIVGLFI